jgi:hypothetical protein
MFECAPARVIPRQAVRQLKLEVRRRCRAAGSGIVLSVPLLRSMALPFQALRRLAIRVRAAIDQELFHPNAAVYILRNRNAG